MRPKTLLVVVAMLGALLQVGAIARASATDPCSAPQCARGSLTAPNGEALPFDVILPPGYATSGRRYPVVYLLAGGLENQDSWIAGTLLLGPSSLLSFLTALAPAQQAIVVLPYSGTIGWYSDWSNGAHDYETVDTQMLISYIDGHYRTIADRAHRAVAGLSMGGFGAMDFAARHPDLYVAAGSFSGPVDNTDPIWEAVLTGATPAVSIACTLAAGNDPVGVCNGDDPPLADTTGVTPWGDPITDAAIWHGHDPASLDTNLASVNLFVAAGSGIPCTLDDVEPVLMGGEALFHYLSEEFVGVLARDGVAYQTSFPACGVHDFNNWMARLREWWPIMVAALGTPPPTTFSYRSTDAAFSVWGWSVSADAARSPEFLQMSDVTPSGLTLTGSGRTTVTTPPVFAPETSVGLTGATAPSATSDATGRLTFTVDLGPAHTIEEYTPLGLVVAAQPGYFHTSVVTFAVPGT
jgi:S-formylglutathione hydrolase FrmB